MALDAGEVDVDVDGNASGSGLALAIFNGALSAVSSEQRKQVAAAMAPFCNGVAAAIVDHIRENAEVSVTITTADAGLQTVPNPVTPGAPTAGPPSDVTFTGTLT